MTPPPWDPFVANKGGYSIRLSCDRAVDGPIYRFFAAGLRWLTLIQFPKFLIPCLSDHSIILVAQAPSPVGLRYPLPPPLPSQDLKDLRDLSQGYPRNSGPP